MSGRTVCVIGLGRAGSSFHQALSTIGWTVHGIPGSDARARSDRIGNAGVGVDLVLVCVPDDHVEAVAGAVAPTDAVVAHIAGSLTLDVLSSHERCGSLHPLMSLPDPTTGARRLLEGCPFAVAGDPMLWEVAEALRGAAFAVEDDVRTRYHATAAIASNHLVALCAQVERLARSIDVPAPAFWQLMQTTLENVAGTSPAESLTGPAARGDWGTIGRHLAELDPEDAALYRPLAEAAARLAGHTMPDSA